MNRTWFYSRMMGNAALLTDLPGGIHQSTALAKAPVLKPFAMYRSIADRPGDRGDDVDLTLLETFLVFVHDVPGDYLKIDEVLTKLRDLFVNAKDKSAGVSRCTWLENSEDFRDEDMGTILRYARVSIRYLP